ncbi:MAG: hypothetical protein IJM46_01350 [Oscillospiraceae bacterium]|nr:hypothetical protein [Oscillospiraceae bacterium]
MKKTIAMLSTAVMAAGLLTQPASAADLMTFRFAADKTAFTTDELKDGDQVVHGGLYIDNYSALAEIRMILKSDAPVIIENGDFTKDAKGELDSDGNIRDAFFEKHSTHMYTQKSTVDDDTNIILWAGPETQIAGEFHANGVVRNSNASFLSFDYRIPKGTAVGDYRCYISEKVITNKAGFIEEDLEISDSKHQLELGKDFAIQPITFSVYTRGDVNCDGSVSIEDAQAALILYTEQEVASRTLSDQEMEEITKTKHVQAAKLAADASQNSKIDATDPQGILEYYVTEMAGNQADWSKIFK